MANYWNSYTISIGIDYTDIDYTHWVVDIYPENFEMDFDDEDLGVETNNNNNGYSQDASTRPINRQNSGLHCQITLHKWYNNIFFWHLNFHWATFWFLPV